MLIIIHRLTYLCNSTDDKKQSTITTFELSSNTEISRNTITLKSTPYSNYYYSLLYLSKAQWRGYKTMQGGEESDKDQDGSARRFVKIYGGEGARNSANSRDKKLSIVPDERRLGGNWSSPGQQSIETGEEGGVLYGTQVVNRRHSLCNGGDRIEAAVSRGTMARHNGENGPALLKHRVIRWTKSSGERFFSNDRPARAIIPPPLLSLEWSKAISGFRFEWTVIGERDSSNFNNRILEMFSKKFAGIEE